MSAADRSRKERDEDAVVRRAIAGDRDAFETLYRSYAKKVFNLVYRMLGDPSDAEDATQEIFCQAYRGLARFEARSRFYTWLFRIASNIGLQRARQKIRLDRRRLLQARDLAGEAASTAGHRADPERSAERQALAAAVLRAINELPPDQRVVMLLGPIQGHSYEQMATILQKSPEVIKARLQRARNTVRRLVSAASDEAARRSPPRPGR